MCFRIGASSNVARREFPLRNRLTIFSLSIAIAASLLAGCSGGGSSGTPGTIATPTPVPTPVPPSPVAVKAAIAWGPRSRATNYSSGFTSGPSSALSASIKLIGASTIGGDLTALANRDTTQVSGYTGTYTLGPGQAVPGKSYALHVDFYAQANGAGAIVATADSLVGNASINPDGTLTFTIGTTGRIQSVRVVDIATGTGQLLNGTLGIGQSADVYYSAYDGPNGTGNQIAVTPGSGFVTSISDGTKLTALGDKVQATGPTTGITFTVTVDNVESAPFTLKVTSSTSVTLVATPTSTQPVIGSPTAPTVSPGIPQTFAATVTGDPSLSGVTFLLKEGATAGTLGAVTTTPGSGTTTSTVTYTPPATLPPTPVTYHLIATSKYDPNVSTTIPITVASQVAVAVTPIPTTPLSIKSSTQFNAVVTSIPTGGDTTVTWSIDEGLAGGSITSSGLYLAPATQGTYHVRATSNFDPTKFVDLAVAVQSLVRVAIAPPGPLAISINASQLFTPNVTGQATGGSAAVTWKVLEADGGTITAAGLYTAPANVPAEAVVHVIATSVFDPNNPNGTTAVAITVQAGTLPVTVN
jgi:hypothetical protein